MQKKEINLSNEEEEIKKTTTTTENNDDNQKPMQAHVWDEIFEIRVVPLSSIIIKTHPLSTISIY